MLLILAELIVMTVFVVMIVACVPFGHPGIPDKADNLPLVGTGQPNVGMTPEPSPTPESACEIDSKRLNEEIKYCRDSLSTIRCQDHYEEGYDQ